MFIPQIFPFHAFKPIKFAGQFSSTNQMISPITYLLIVLFQKLQSLFGEYLVHRLLKRPRRVPFCVKGQQRNREVLTQRHSFLSVVSNAVLPPQYSHLFPHNKPNY